VLTGSVQIRTAEVKSENRKDKNQTQATKSTDEASIAASTEGPLAAAAGK
jgi:hypothetical protein